MMKPPASKMLERSQLALMTASFPVMVCPTRSVCPSKQRRRTKKK